MRPKASGHRSAHLDHTKDYRFLDKRFFIFILVMFDSTDPGKHIQWQRPENKTSFLFEMPSCQQAGFRMYWAIISLHVALRKSRSLSDKVRREPKNPGGKIHQRSSAVMIMEKDALLQISSSEPLIHGADGREDYHHASYILRTSYRPVKSTDTILRFRISTIDFHEDMMSAACERFGGETHDNRRKQ